MQISIGAEIKSWPILKIADGAYGKKNHRPDVNNV